MKNKSHSTIVNIAEAKRLFSHLVGRVAFGGDVITLARRDKPVAQIVPIFRGAKSHLANVKGWLDKDDSFFDRIQEIVGKRQRHTPRILRSQKSR